MTDPRRIAWVTGAGKGIGRALALRLARDGWTVAISARTQADLDAVASEAAQGAIKGFPLDITDEAGTAKTVAAIETDLGPIDLAVLNAGTHVPVTLDAFSPEPFRKLLDTNVMGAVYGLTQLVPRFVERGRGRIAVVASVAGFRGLPSASAYGASKAAVINMCEALKPDLEAKGVELTLINPGFVETPLTDKNDFPMPFLITADKAADAIAKGLGRSGFEIAFPWRFAMLMKLLRILPDRLFFMLTRRMVRA